MNTVKSIKSKKNRKVILLSLVILFFSLTILILGVNYYKNKTQTPIAQFATDTPPAKTITVCPDNYQGTATCQYRGGGGLQKALENANSGDTINMIKGEYKVGDHLKTITGYTWRCDNQDFPKIGLYLPTHNPSRKDFTIKGNGSTINVENKEVTALFTFEMSSNVKIENLKVFGFKPQNEGDFQCGGYFINTYDNAQLDINGLTIVSTSNAKPSGVIYALNNTKTNINNLISAGVSYPIIIREGAEVELKNSVIEKAYFPINLKNESTVKIINSIIVGGEEAFVWTRSSNSNPVNISYSLVSGNGNNNQPDGQVIFGPEPKDISWNTDPKITNIDVNTGKVTFAPDSPVFNSGDPSIKNPDGSRSNIGPYGGPNACLLDNTIAGCNNSGDTGTLPINSNWQGPIASLTMPDGTNGKPQAQAEVYLGQGKILQTVFLNNKAYNRYATINLSTGTTNWGTFSNAVPLSSFGLPSGESNKTVTAYGLTYYPPNKIISTIFVGNQGYARPIQFNVNGGNVNFSNVGTWKKISLPGAVSGNIQAYDYAYYPNDNGFFLETYAKNNNLYYRFLKKSEASTIDKAITKTNATDWYGPNKASDLPGNGDFITYSYYVVNGYDKISQAFWKGTSGGYVRELRYTNITYPTTPPETTTSPTPTEDTYSITFVPSQMTIGINNNYNLEAKLFKNGTEITDSTELNKYTYLWTTANAEVATVSAKNACARQSGSTGCNQIYVNGISAGKTSIRVVVKLSGTQVAQKSISVTVTKGGDIPTPTPGPNPSKYDVNKDGIANLTDLLLLIQGVFKY